MKSLTLIPVIRGLATMLCERGDLVRKMVRSRDPFERVMLQARIDDLDFEVARLRGGS